MNIREPPTIPFAMFGFQDPARTIWQAVLNLAGAGVEADLVRITGSVE